MTASNRPLSPHLQIYRWQWTMTLSILHRATGVALSVGALLLVLWLLQLAGDGEGYRGLQDFLGSWFGRLLLFGWTFSLFFHLCNGIRHLVWDAGYGYHLDTAYASAIAVVAASGVLTVLAWVAGYMAMGS